MKINSRFTFCMFCYMMLFVLSSATVLGVCGDSVDIEVRIFDNENDGNARDDGNRGINDVTAYLVRVDANTGSSQSWGEDTSGLGTFPDFTPQNGVVSIQAVIDTGYEYYVYVDLSQPNLAGMTHVDADADPGNDDTDSDGIRMTNTLVRAEISMDGNCEPNSITEFGFQSTSSFCGDGTLNTREKESCDFGASFNGDSFFSTDDSIYSSFDSATTCQIGIPRHNCDSFCYLTSDTANTFCPNCDNTFHVACSENASNYGDLTYGEDSAVSRAFCGHDGTSWSWRNGISNLDDYETTYPAEFCGGRVNSIDQNCNAHNSFNRFDNGSVNYASYIYGGKSYNVIPDVDAFDPLCSVNLTGNVRAINGIGLGNTNMSIFIVSGDGDTQYFRSVMTNAFGAYNFTDLPATRYVLSATKAGYSGPTENLYFLEYKSNDYQKDFTLRDGVCNSDCTSAATPGYCDKSCDNIAGCAFHPGYTDILDGKAVGVRFYDDARNETITACNGVPQPGNRLSSGVNAGSTTCSDGETLVVANNVVLYQGRPAILKVAVCREQ